MHRTSYRTTARRGALLLVLAAAGLGAAACSDDNDGSGSGPDAPRQFNQIQRLGNPLVSEVLLSKRSHATHGTTDPTDDASLVAPEILSFITGPGSVAGRSADYANVLGSVLLPDALVVYTDRDPATAGWLTWLPQLGSGYGGRKPSDDVTDLALLAVFGDPFGLDPDGAAGKEGLTTDNVGFDSPVQASFPYLAGPN
jgi:hypothetical protein